MKRNLYLLGLLLLCLGAGPMLKAQVSGLSYNIQPTLAYDFYDDDAALSDAFLYGGRVGFGFGQNVELRGLYMRSTSLTNDFEAFGLEDIDALQERDVNLTRYGGEVKLNLARTRLLPFLNIGAGIQEFDVDGGEQSESIYASLGLGVTFKVFDRFNLNIEGRNFSYSGDPVRNLLTPDDRDVAGVDIGDFDGDRVNNWSINAGLEFHLGGRDPDQLTELDRAYQQAFGSGFNGASVLVEPTLARVNWDDDMPYVNTYLGGASAGVDFGPLVGARLFYYRSMEDDEINLDFDDLSMYGADFRFRFSPVTTGLSPFLTIGGGYIDVQDDYLNAQETFGAPSQGFATGGGGISLNLSPNFRLTGTYRALLTTASDVEDLNSTDQVRTSSMWSAGINFAFGNRARRPDAVFSSTAQARVAAQQAEDEARMQAALARQAQENAQATNQLRADYETRLIELRDELDQARIRQDSAQIARLEQQVDETEDVVDELEKRAEDYTEEAQQASRAQADASARAADASTVAATQQAQQTRTFNNQSNVSSTSGRISLSPAELEGLIEEIFEGINDGLAMPPPVPMRGGQRMDFSNGQFSPSGSTTMQDTGTVNQMRRDIADLRAQLDEQRQQQQDDKAALREEMSQSTQTILDEIREMRQEVRRELDNKANMTDRERRRLQREIDDANDSAEDAERSAREIRREQRRNRRNQENEEGNN